MPRRTRRRLSVFAGRTQAGIAAARRAVVLDPLNRTTHHSLGLALYFGRQTQEAIAAERRSSAAMRQAEPLLDALFAYFIYSARGDFSH
jgi:hypothetical protein